MATPAFAIRKSVVAVFTLGDYIAAGIMSAAQAEALLAEVAKTSDGVVIIKDTGELQCAARNLVALLSDLVRSSLRLRPDRISTGLALAFGDTSGGVCRLIQIVLGLSIAFAASQFVLPVVLLLQRRSARLMAAIVEQGADMPGYTVPLHHSLAEPILLGGAPRAIAIMNGTLAGAVGLGLRLWLVGLAVWAIGHTVSV